MLVLPLLFHGKIWHYLAKIWQIIKNVISEPYLRLNLPLKMVFLNFYSLPISEIFYQIAIAVHIRIPADRKIKKNLKWIRID